MEEALQIAICEDSAPDAQRLLDILSSCPISSIPTVFPSGEDFLAAYEPQKFDLLLSDIYMGGITGVDMVTRLRETDRDLPVAFITTSTDHALEGYRLSVCRYIEKPFKKEDINEVLRIALLERSSAPALEVQLNGRNERIRFSRILYLEQQTHHVNIYLKNGEPVQLYDKLTALLPQLEQQDFFQPHKSYCVNLAAVRSIDPELKCFVLQNGVNIPIRRESMSKARQALKERLFRRTREGRL